MCAFGTLLKCIVRALQFPSAGRSATPLRNEARAQDAATLDAAPRGDAGRQADAGPSTDAGFDTAIHECDHDFDCAAAIDVSNQLFVESHPQSFCEDSDGEPYLLDAFNGAARIDPK